MVLGSVSSPRLSVSYAAGRGVTIYNLMAYYGSHYGNPVVKADRVNYRLRQTWDSALTRALCMGTPGCLAKDGSFQSIFSAGYSCSSAAKAA